MPTTRPWQLRARITEFAIAIRILLVLVAISAASLLVVAWSINDSRIAARRQAEQQEHNIVLAIQKEIERTVQAIDLTLQAAVKGMATPGVADMDPAIRQAILFDAGGFVDQLGDTLITDANGMPLYRSVVGQTTLTLADRPFFQRHLRQDGLGLFVDAPTQRQYDGHWVLPFSRRINRQMAPSPAQLRSRLA